jgi:hypothetical protein
VKNWMIMPLEEVIKAAFYDPSGPLAQQMLTVPEDEKEAQLQLQHRQQ